MSEARRVELRLEFLNIDVPDDLADRKSVV